MTQTPNFTATQADEEAARRSERTFPNGATLQRGAAVRDTCAELFDSVGCIIGTKGRKKNERGLPHGELIAVSEGNVAENMTVPRKAIGISINDYRSTIDARLRQCGTARPRSHFPIYQSQQPERCRRKAALKFSYYITNRYFCKRKICPHKKKHTSAIKNHIYVVLYGGLIWVMQLIYLCIN